MRRSEETRGLPQQPRAFLPAANGAHDRQLLRGARMREVQARSFPQVHGEHGASAHQEFEERLLGWAHSQVAHRSLRWPRVYQRRVGARVLRGLPPVHFRRTFQGRRR